MTIVERDVTDPEPPGDRAWPADTIDVTVPLTPHARIARDAVPGGAVDEPDDGTGPDRTNLIQLHESIATLHASRGEYHKAYQHLRSAYDLATAEQAPQIPEQLRREVDRLRKEHAEAHEQSIRDGLTASYNRRYLDQRLVALGSAAPAPAGLAIALVDLDWFKKVNDTHGHLIGDQVLRRVVELLQYDLPDGAFCARYGGEEFVLVLPGINGPAAIALAEAARARVERHPWAAIAPGLRVTVSVGLAHATSGSCQSGNTPERQLGLADGLLYAAKLSGRNAVAFQTGGKTRLTGATGERDAVTEPRALIR